MKDKHAVSDSIIIKTLCVHYGLQVASLTRLNLGADIHASLYKAQTHDETSYFIKLKQGLQHETSIEIAGLLKSAGVEGIIFPIETVHGMPAQAIDECTLIVYPFVDGQDGFSRKLTAHQWIKLGKALKRIHEVEVPPSIQSRIRKETYSSRWREAVRSIYALVEEGSIEDETASKLQKFMMKHMPEIRRLVDRAEDLGKQLKGRPPEFVLCHSDIHAGNVLMDETQGIYLLDWDEPIMAPKERDLMFIGGGVGNVWNEPSEEAYFYEGYGKTKVDLMLLSYYRHERIVEDIAIYSQELFLKSSGGEGREEMLGHFKAMFAPRGVVEIAFETDEGLSARK